MIVYLNKDDFEHVDRVEDLMDELSNEPEFVSVDIMVKPGPYTFVVGEEIRGYRLFNAIGTLLEGIS